MREIRVMDQSQITILAILAATVVLFMWGRWRHDMVASAALLACIFTGLVSADAAFNGLGHPAVITVACVLVLSKGLQSSGAVDVLARTFLPAQSGPVVSIVALTGLGAVLSAFMNNVGALALLMPIALQMARRQQLPPGKILMPLAFGTILGGMTTLIGTPPNLIVSGFRQASSGDGFSMFDYTPVGLAVALAGIVFIALIGWRLVPGRKQAGMEGFESGAYITEARVPEGSKAEGLTLRELETALTDADAQILGLVRNSVRVMPPSPRRRTRAGDILMLEAEAEALSQALSSLGLKLEEDLATKEADKEKESKKEKSQEDNGTREAVVGADSKKEKKDGKDKGESDSSDEIVLMELVILPSSELLGRTAKGIQLRTRFGVNLLAVSRQGQRSFKRLRALAFRAGDLLLMQGSPELIAEFASSTGCVPLAERELRIPDKKKALMAGGIMAASVTVAALGWLPAAVAFASGVLASMVLRTVPPRSVYNAVDWPVVVLLAALIPVADVMETTGTASLVAAWLLDGVAQGSALVALALILVVTMTLSDVMNNAATAAVMCPIALGAASQLGVNADPFLMAVAIGGSCAFLTPIGHQNNTLILGPGGFRFGDYWRMGLPLELLVVAISLPMLLWVWPL
ncbi:SLC13 family permease [Oceanimonas sp. CAM02]|uniref:SLC13 family permease n=1 Tax=Oceanimonas sp. CAM02 TaxID=3080336 RepID=UPI002935E515|nr:SLC13 family permease [Oceanimonas sp. CAM02]MDV2858249.1 SLC13 family permease [Oceanimonas sp. CAM02]